MALVAYGSSGESSDSEDDSGPSISINGGKKSPGKSASFSKPVPRPDVAESFLSKPVEVQDFNISDDEDEEGMHSHNTNGHFIDDFQEPDLLSLISKKLPYAQINTSASFVDKNEDSSTICKKVDYGTKIEEPPAKKKKRDGPVKISIPSLKQLKQLEEEEEELRPVPRVTASKKGSGLFALLPDPKNKMTRNRPINVAVPETGEEGSYKPPVLPEGTKNNLKPSGVRRTGLVPHIVANPVPRASTPPPSSSSTSSSAGLLNTRPDSDSDEEDFMGLNSGAYFPEPEASKPIATSSTEYIYGMKKPPMPLLPVTSDYVSLNLQSEEELGPAVAPYPPVATSLPDHTLVDNEAAIARLAGKAAKRREFEDMKIIDINEADMRGDPNVWLTKAMTEEQAPAPNRKSGPKGLVKSRHQITYLAHQAKERDWELRQEWSQARANKRASMNKYGFC